MTPRLKAFAIHLAISALIALAVIGLVFFIWYPAPLHTAVGVTQIFLILLAVDVALGPLLTLLVYKAGKKTLVMDLTVIALLQLSALGYGLWTVAEGRPAWLVFSIDRFELVRINDIDERKLDEAATEYRKPSWFGPKWVAGLSPTNIEEKNELIFEAIAGGPDVAQRPNLYQPLLSQSQAVRQKALPISELNTFNSEERVHQLLTSYPSANGWLPLSANAQDMVVLVNKDTAEIISIVNLRPWH